MITEITITGNGFTLLSNTLAFLVQDDVKKYDLEIISFSPTEIRCLLGGGKTGVYDVRIYDSTKGASSINSIT